MKNLFYSSIVILLAASCASSDNKTQGEVDLDKIENSDFEQVKPIQYVAKRDVFKGEILDEKTVASTAKESIDRAPKKVLKKAEDDDDPLTAAAGYCYRHDFKNGFKVLDRAYNKYQNHPGYWNQMGTCYLLQEDYRKALLYYNRVTAIDPKYVPVMNNWGVMYLRQGEDQKALHAFEQAKAQNNFSVTPIFNLAQLYLQYGFADKAEVLFEALYRRGRNDMDVLSGLGSVKLMQGKHQEALKYFDQIDSDFLERPDISLNYAYALYLNGRADDAEDLLDDLKPKKLADYKDYYFKLKKLVRGK